jgi:hypothetical protein
MSLDENMVGNDGSFAVKPDATDGVRVSSVRLDDLVAKLSIDRVSVIKIDVEGSEPAVLEGANETLRRFAPTLIMEINPTTLASHGHSLQDLFRFLTTELGYNVWRFSGTDGGLTQLKSFDALQQCNVLASRCGPSTLFGKSVGLRDAQRWASLG